MPSRIVLTLDHSAGAHPIHVHGAACALLEHPGSRHHAVQKPFAATPPAGGRWRLGWLTDTAPRLDGVTAVTFGARTIGIRSLAVQATTFAALADAEPVHRAELRMISPTFFRRQGADHPVPDPTLIVDSAVRRYLS